MLFGRPPPAAQSLLSSRMKGTRAKESSNRLLYAFVPVFRAVNRSTASSAPQSMSGFEVRVSLVLALASQSASLSRRLYADLTAETVKYVMPKRFETRSLEEALMSVPDLETVNFKVLARRDRYEVREVEVTKLYANYSDVSSQVLVVLGFTFLYQPYFIAETTMPGKSGFSFNGSSNSFNVLAAYLFGQNVAKETMEMTTPVITRKTAAAGEKMEMTTPVITRKMENKEKWQMSFVLPSKYGSNVPLPSDPSVRLEEVPRKIVAVSVFSGFVTDADVLRRESELRKALKSDREFCIKEGAEVEVAQYNPPFTLPFARRNEIALEIERTL